MDLRNLVVGITFEDKASKALKTVDKKLDDVESGFSKMGKQVQGAENSVGKFGRNGSRFIDKAKESLSKFDKGLKDSSKQASSAAGSMKSAFLGIGAAIGGILAIDKIKDLGVSMVQAAADADALGAQFEQVFGKLGSDAQKSIDKMGKDFGMVPSRLKAPLSQMTSMFKGLGMNTEDAMGQASKAVTLTADAAAFYDKSFEDANSALNSFIKGNYEGGESIGLFGSETQIASWAAKELGVDWKTLDEQGKQVSRLKFAESMQKAAGATGQAKRESEGLENQLGNMRQIWTDIQAKFGKPLLGVVLEEMKGVSTWAQNFNTDNLVSSFTSFIDKVKEGIKDIKSFIGVMKDNWNTIENVAIGIGTFVTVLGVAKGAVALYTGVQLAMNAAMTANPVGLVIVGIAALVAIGVVLWKNWDKVKTKTIELWNKLGVFKGVVLGLLGPIGAVIGIGVTLYKNWDKIKATAGTLATTVVSKFTTLKTNTGKLLTLMKDEAKKRFNDMIDAAKALPGKMGAGIKSMAGKAVAGVTSMGNSLVSKIGKVVNGVIDGLNWATKGVGIKVKIDNWKVPQYAQGTGGHPGGPAILGDGRGNNAGPELFRTPDGQTGLSPGKDTMMNLPKGTQVLSARETREVLGGIPAYAKGIGSIAKDAAGWVGGKAKAGANWAGDKAKAGASAVADTASDIWSYASNPSKLMDVIMKKFGVSMPKFDGAFGNIAKGGFNLVKDKATKFLKDKLGDFGIGGSAGNITGGASAWRGQIIKAAAVMQEALSGSELNGIIAQIQRESGGNQRIVQSPEVRDINTRNGNPAKGLLQYIPQTFASYRMPGAGNIFDGYHQLLAFFNNRNWRRDLPYGRRGWGPTGGRKFPGYADGTGGPLANSEWAWVGERGPELLHLKKGTTVHNNKDSRAIAARPTTPVAPVINYSPNVKIEVNGNSANSSEIRRAVKEALDDQYNRLMGIYETGVVL